jgi:hypothetical protein
MSRPFVLCRVYESFILATKLTILVIVRRHVVIVDGVVAALAVIAGFGRLPGEAGSGGVF